MIDLTRPLGMASVPELRDDGPVVVAMGGGHGLSMVLKAAVDYARKAVGVVTVADDGGSSGRLTSAIDMPPPGDMRRCMLALAPDDSVERRVFGYRFTDTDVAGHSMGNLILATLTEIIGDFEQALVVAGEMVGARGRTVPVSTNPMRMAAEVAGRWVHGQAAVSSAVGLITDVRLEPDEKANPRAIEAIEAADQIIVAPGSLYTSVLSCAMVDGVSEAINRAPGELVVVLNLTTQDGETLGMTGRDHIEALMRFSGIDREGVLIVNGAPFEAPEPVEALTVEAEEAAAFGFELRAFNLLDSSAEWPQHHLAALRSALEETILRRAT